MALLALLASLSVYVLNGAPLYYFDTAGYLEQGSSILGFLGFDEVPANAAHIERVAAPASFDDHADDDTVAGARSAAYALALATLARFNALQSAVLLNLAAIWLIVFKCARHLTGQAYMASSVSLIAASTGSLPFYAAFLMPDILAPVLILAIALFAAYADRLNRGEMAAAVLLSVAAVISHPSHLIIAVMLLPVAGLASPRFGGRAVTVALVGLLVAFGVSERFLFGYAIERLKNSNVFYLPFLTARLIDDGPGYDYLAGRCPDSTYPTCMLYEKLSESDDPISRDAPMVLFSNSPEFGSFGLLDEDQKMEVSGDQFRFVADVVRDAPVGVAGALASNTVEQLAALRVNMTLMEPAGIAVVRKSYATAEALRDGRLLAADRAWLGLLGFLHAGVYLASTAIILVLMLLPGRLDRRARLFAAMTLAGIFTNALVCGGISEPAERYGARTMFLLPLLATLLMFSAYRTGFVRRRDVTVSRDVDDTDRPPVSGGVHRSLMVGVADRYVGRVDGDAATDVPTGRLVSA